MTFSAEVTFEPKFMRDIDYAFPSTISYKFHSPVFAISLSIIQQDFWIKLLDDFNLKLGHSSLQLSCLLEYFDSFQKLMK